MYVYYVICYRTHLDVRKDPIRVPFYLCIVMHNDESPIY